MSWSLDCTRLNVIQTLAGSTSVNSVFGIWGFSFSLAGVEGTVMSSGFLFCFSVLRSGPACAAPDLGRGINLPVPFFSFNAQVQLRTASASALPVSATWKLNPAVILSLHAETAGFFFFSSPSGLKRLWKSHEKEKFCAKRQKCKHPVFCASQAGPAVSTAVFLCHLPAISP